MLNSQSQTGTYAAAILRSPKLLQSLTELSVHLKLKSQLNNILDIGREILKMFPNIPSLPLGKLATKDEPNKVRVFAIVDPITQWLMQPLHRHLFFVLKTHFKGVDATFDQEAGVEQARLAILAKTDKKVYSFDLSAATDRLVLLIQIAILNGMVPGMGTSWGSCLVDRDYHTPAKYKHLPKSVRYAVGQPMGALSSWAMLAVTHHFVISVAVRLAKEEGVLAPNVNFTEYMILGDDIIIWNESVAKRYHKVMTSILGVGINLNKSLISNKGVFEFAKRLVHPETGIMSAVPLKEFGLVSKNIAVLETLFKNFRTRPSVSQIMRILGFGYKSLGRLNSIRVKGRAGYALNWALLPGVSASSSLSFSDWFHRNGIQSGPQTGNFVSDETIIDALTALLAKSFYKNYDLKRLDTSKIFNWNLWVDTKYKKIFSSDTFVNRVDFALDIVYRNVVSRALDERKFFDELSNVLIPKNGAGIDTIVELLLKSPAISLVLADEVETPKGTYLRLDEIIRSIVVHKLILIKNNPHRLANLLTSLEWVIGTEPNTTPWDLQFISEQPAFPKEITDVPPSSPSYLSASTEQQRELNVPEQGAPTTADSDDTINIAIKGDFSLFLASVKNGSVVVDGFDPASIKGSGTKDDPYVIDDDEDE